MFLAKVLHRLQLKGKLGGSESQGEESGAQGEEFPAKKRPRLETEEEVEETVDRAKAFESRTLMLLPESDGEGEGPEKEGEGLEEGGRGQEAGVRRRRRDVKWLMKRMSRLASYEAGHNPKESIKVPFARLSTSLFTCLFTCMFVYPFVYLFVYLFVYFFVYLLF